MKIMRYNVMRLGLLGICFVVATAVGMPSTSIAEAGREGEVTEVMTYAVAPGKDKGFEEARSAMFSFLKTQPGFGSVTSRQDLKNPSVHVDISVWATRAHYQAASAALPEKLRVAFMGTVSEWKYFGLTQ